MKRSLMMLLISLMLGAVGCADFKVPWNFKTTPPKEEANKHWSVVRARVKLQLAQRAFENGSLDDALTHCREVIGLDPEMPEAYELLTQIQLERGELAQAEETLQYAGTLKDSPPELLYLHGVIAERRGTMTEAADYYLQAYHADPDQVDYLLATAEALIAVDRVDEATTLLEARRLDFEHEATLHALLAEAFVLLDRFREAGDEYLVAVHLAPHDDLLREEAVLALARTDRPSEASLLLEPVLAESDAKVNAYTVEAVADAFLRADRSNDAIRVLQHGLRCCDDKLPIWAGLARAQLAAGDQAAASEALAQATKLAPNDPRLRLLRAYQAYTGGQLDNAIAIARDLIARDPDDLEARSLLAKALEQQPQTLSDAADQYREIVARFPGNDWARNHLADLESTATLASPAPENN